MTTLFSVNLNKLALIRNSRGSNYPNLTHFMKRMIDLGVQSFTVHPRPDERHITYQDCYDIKEFLQDYPNIEFNIEGNPHEKFLQLIEQIKPDQCTLVPDSEDQLTSDHGFDIIQHHTTLQQINERLLAIGTRCAVFVDPNVEQIKALAQTDITAIELYTESWALHHNQQDFVAMQTQFAECVTFANQQGLRTNAGHDLNLQNLADLLALGNVDEVSIGHAFTIECIEQGIDTVVTQYLAICA